MSVIDIYYHTITSEQKAALERIRQIVKELVPDAEETISYGMPAFKYRKKYLVGFIAYKDHLSLHPTPEPIAALKDKLTGYKTAKGTIQFTLEKPLPKQLIKEIIKIRLAAINA